MRNQTYEYDFDLHENEIAYRYHFHMKGLAPRLVMNRGTRELGNELLSVMLSATVNGVSFGLVYQK